MTRRAVEFHQDQINRIKTALRARSEKEAINFVLSQFDTDLQSAGKVDPRHP